MPQWFHLESSEDGLAFDLVKGSDIKVGKMEDASILEYYWNGSDF